jgi:hypothetical protein
LIFASRVTKLFALTEKPVLFVEAQTAIVNLEAFVELQEQRRLNARLRRQKELQEQNGVLFYRPHEKQDKFHSSLAVGRYLRTGNRFGKSDSGAAEDVAWLRGQREWYKYKFDVKGVRREVDGTYTNCVVRYHNGHEDHPLVRAGIPQRPVKGLLLVVDWDKAKEIHTNREGSYENWGKLFKLIPRDAIENVVLSRGGHVVQIHVRRADGNGTSVLYIDTVESYKHNKMGAESSDWDFIHVDEPCPHSMWKAHSRGLTDRNGYFWFTCTPIDEMWMNDEFVPDAQHVIKDANEGLAFTKHGLANVTRFIITGTIFDNPYISQAGRENFLSSLTREEVQCRAYGLPLALAGMVYKEFIYDMHVLADVPAGWQDYHLPPPHYTIRVAWDVHGARVPQAILFAATAPDGTVFIYDEMFYEPLIGPNCGPLKRKLKSHNVIDMIADPRAFIKNPVTSIADIEEEWARHNLFFYPATKDLTTGISRVKEKLSERHSVTRLPTIFFSPRLAETLFEFTHYVYDTKTNEPKDANDHMMENLYRLVMNGLSYVPLQGEFKSRPFIIHDNVDVTHTLEHRDIAPFLK